MGSLLSFIGKLAGHTPEAGQLTAKAGVEGATFKRLPLTSISAAFTTRPPALRRKLVTSGAQRLQRVMLGAVSNYLGLPSKLLKSFVKEHAGPYTQSVVSFPLFRKAHPEREQRWTFCWRDGGTAGPLLSPLRWTRLADTPATF